MKRSNTHKAAPLVFLLALCMSITLLPYAAATAQSTKSQKSQIKPQQRTKPQLHRAGSGYKIKKGTEVAAKVKKLRESNREVAAALKLFEDKKRPPKIDNAFAITGTLSRSTAELFTGGPTLRKASFTQTTAIAGTDVELIFVPVLTLDMEWQGTVISNLYDSTGAIAGQYVADSVLIMPDPNLYAWDEVYEAPVYRGTVLAAIAEPGMFTNVDLGIPLSQQQLSREMGGASSSVAIRPVGTGSFQSGQAVIRAWANCTFGWCGGAGLSCVGTDLWGADVLASSCFSSSCGNYAIGCVWGTIWR
jgi:hypothetical protein